MAIKLANYDAKARKAVKLFWQGREQAKKKQVSAGKADQGERSSVTAGKNMDGFIDLIEDIVCANGLSRADIYRNRSLLTLPGHFRPTKLWDLLIISEGKLIAALEFKSHVGPSFGNNFNNRAEEAIGTAHDLWTAYREGAFGEQPQPFVGWLMLLEDAPGSQKPVKDAAPHFQVSLDFQNASYAERYNVLCRRLMQEKLYTVATVLTSPRSSAKSGGFKELSDVTGLHTFVTQLAAHVAASAAQNKKPK